MYGRHVVTVGFPEVTSSLGLRWNSLRRYVSSHSFFCSGSQVVRGKGKEKASNWSCFIGSMFILSSLCYVIFSYMYRDETCCTCFPRMAMHKWCNIWLETTHVSEPRLILYFRIVWLMYPVSVMTYVLIILDSFNADVTKILL